MGQAGDCGCQPGNHYCAEGEIAEQLSGSNARYMGYCDEDKRPFHASAFVTGCMGK